MKKNLLIIAVLFCAVLLSTQAEAQQEKQFTFSNRAGTHFLSVVNNKIKLSNQKEQPENVWIVEPLESITQKLKGGEVTVQICRIKHKSTGKYLHIENGTLELGNIKDGWESAQWGMRPLFNMPDGYFRLYNVWKPEQFLSIQNNNSVEAVQTTNFGDNSMWIKDDVE